MEAGFTTAILVLIYCNLGGQAVSNASRQLGHYCSYLLRSSFGIWIGNGEQAVGRSVIWAFCLLLLLYGCAMGVRSLSDCCVVVFVRCSHGVGDVAYELLKSQPKIEKTRTSFLLLSDLCLCLS